MKKIADEIGRGPGWIITRKKDLYFLHYQKGELGGGENIVQISQEDAIRLLSGEVSLTNFILDKV